MERKCGQNSVCVPAIDVKELHEEQKSLALSIFNSKMMMGSRAEIQKYSEKLSNDMDNRLQHFMTINMVKQQQLIEAAKNAYDEGIEGIKNGEQFCIHPMDLELAHNTAMARAMEIFNGSQKRFTDKIDIEKDKLIANLESKYQLFKVTNDTNNRRVITEIGMEYWQYMESVTTDDHIVTRNELEAMHNERLAQALGEYEIRRCSQNENRDDMYKDELVEFITNRYNQIKAIKARTNEREIRRAVNAYIQHMDSVWDQRNQTLHPEDLAEENDRAMRKALLSFRPNRQPDADFDTDDEDEKNLKNKLTAEYDQLKERNDEANEKSVESAISVYKTTLTERESPNVSWLLVVPIVVSIVQTAVLTHHEESKKAARREFYKKRRNKGRESTDIYLQKLMAHCDDINRCNRVRGHLGNIVNDLVS